MSKIYIASDHAGFDLKQSLVEYLKLLKINFEDLGTHSKDSVDYPIFAHALALKVLENKARGILICNSGIGVSIAANRHKGIRAALCLNPNMAALSRTHNDSNVLVLAAAFSSLEGARSILDSWLNNDFEGGRHSRRVLQLDQ